MVPRQVILKGIIRNIADVHLQLLQVLDAENLLSGIGVGDNKIAKTKVILDRPAQVLGECFGVFIDENSIYTVDMLSVARIGRGVDDGDIGIFRSYPFPESFSGKLILLSFHAEAHVA